MLDNQSFRVLEDVFVTEGVPEETFVPPPNFHEILIDMRHPGKPVIIEGPSGTGKTCTAKKVLEKIGRANAWLYFSARKIDDYPFIVELADAPSKGVFIIDDFHRLPAAVQSKLSDIAKIAAEEDDANKYPKLVLIGINQVGAALVRFSPDVAKRCGFHKIQAATLEQTIQLLNRGCTSLNISIESPETFHKESGGDYWLTQTLCKTVCTTNEITETQKEKIRIKPDFAKLRRSIVDKLDTAYYDAVKEFCRGTRFRPSNDPYFRLLNFVATKGENSSVDLVELANANPEISGSINNIKDARLVTLLKEKPKAGQYFYYSKESALFSVEDPALFYFIKHLDWARLRKDCGFRDIDSGEVKRWDVAISFAGENRAVARHLRNRLTALDVSVYLDEDYEAKILGKRLGKEFEEVFSVNSRFVVCLLDRNHREKIWPTFERDVFAKRINKDEVIPIYLDETLFPGIPQDLYGIKLRVDSDNENWLRDFDDNVVLKLIDRIA